MTAFLGINWMKCFLKSYFCAMNFLSVDELAENLIILLDISNNNAGEENIYFPAEE